MKNQKGCDREFGVRKIGDNRQEILVMTTLCSIVSCGAISYR
jgi:hypothetical protein